MEVKQNQTNFPINSDIKMEKINDSDTEYCYSAKTEIKEELYGPDSPKLNSHANNALDTDHSSDHIKLEVNIEDIELEEEDKPDFIHVENGFPQNETTRSLRNRSSNRQHSGKPEKSLLYCEICFKYFTHSYNFQRHLRRHAEGNPYKCEICSKEFTRKYRFDRHMKGHTTQKVYTCEICFKQIVQKPNFKRHLTTHSGEGPFKCEICDKQFSEQTSLNKHMRVHREKSLKCEICSKLFAFSNDLKVHFRTHTGEKPYKCENCDMQFAQKTNLKQHMIVHTSEKPYECEICFQLFARARNLKRHLKTHIPENSSLGATNSSGPCPA